LRLPQRIGKSKDDIIPPIIERSIERLPSTIPIPFGRIIINVELLDGQRHNTGLDVLPSGKDGNICHLRGWVKHSSIRNHIHIAMNDGSWERREDVNDCAGCREIESDIINLLVTLSGSSIAYQ